MVGVWAGLSSIPSISTIIPTTHGVAGSHTWSVALSGSVTLTGVGSVIAAGSGSAVAVGSDEHSVQRDGEGWLGSGSEVVLGRADGEKQFIILQHPLHTSGEILSGTVRW